MKADVSISNAFKVLEMVVQKAISNAKLEGYNAAMQEIRSLVGGSGIPAAAPPGKKRGHPLGSKNKPKGEAVPAQKTGRKRKNPWAGLSPDARLARVNAIRKGKGLAPREK